MKLFVHPVYGKKIPWLCRLHLHFFYTVWNAGWTNANSYKCHRCGHEEW